MMVSIALAFTMISNWRLLETELCDISRRHLRDEAELMNLENGDKAIGRWCLGDFYTIISITALAKELADRGIACKTH